MPPQVFTISPPGSGLPALEIRNLEIRACSLSVSLKEKKDLRLRGSTIRIFKFPLESAKAKLLLFEFALTTSCA